jgi:putative tryptophan/tyrosine transport system substrate-binding protein
VQMRASQQLPNGGSRPKPRRRALLLICMAALWLMVAAATSTARAARIVIVLSSEAEPYTQAEASFRNRIPAQGHSIVTTLLKNLADKGLDQSIGPDVDAIVAIGTPAAAWLQQNLPASKPLIYCMVANPASNGLTDGRTNDGVSTDVPLAAQFNLIRESLPQTHVLGMLCHTNTPAGQRQLAQVREVLPADWRLEAVSTEQHDSVAAAIDALIQKGPDVIWTAPDATIYDTASVRALLLAALRAKKPVFGFSPAFVRAGALLGVGVDPRAQGQQAADILLQRLDRIKDAAAPDSRVRPPEQFQIAINLIVAENLGITLPDTLVRRATHQFRQDK